MSRTPPKFYFHLSRIFGSDPFLAQAGGGNISVKVTHNKMAIKTSGCPLREVSPNGNWAWVGHKKLKKELAKIRVSSGRESEHQYAAMLRAASKNGRMISMEAGFHVAIPQKYVVHLHSIAGLILGLLPKSKAADILATVLGDNVSVHWLSAFMPGYELTREISKLIGSKRKTNSKTVDLWLLKNHGIIWSADDPSILKRTADQFEKFARRWLGADRFEWPLFSYREKNGVTASFRHWPKIATDLRAVFPDSAVYFGVNASGQIDVEKISDRKYYLPFTTMRNTRDRFEVFCAQMTISALAHEKNCFRPYPIRLARSIRLLETERHRLAQSSRQ